MIHQYRKKPVVIEAWCFHADPFARRATPRPEWLHDAISKDVARFYAADNHGATYGTINTLEGVMKVDQGDWIIRGVAGELYPCKPDIFAATYEKVEP